MMEQEIYWYWLNNIEGIGRVAIRRLLEEYEDPCYIYEDAEDREIAYLLQTLDLSGYHASKDRERLQREYENLQKKGVTFTYPGKTDYPERLCCIPDAPLGLYYKGALPEESQKAIAIIGARNCSRYGMEMARFFGRELAKCDIAVISGLARGIDGMGHKGALEGNGYTLGILGCGVDIVYPTENYELFMKMERQGGILSESNIGIQPFAGLFPQRNRLIAGMSDGILVIEAREKSGTFITVDQGLEQGKEIFALPGKLTDPKSAGCNNLIKLGAHLVTEVADVLEVLHYHNRDASYANTIGEVPSVKRKLTLAPNEKMVYSCLQIEPKYLDDIIKEAGIAPQDVCMLLNQLVMKGMIVESSRNYYAVKL